MKKIVLFLIVMAFALSLNAQTKLTYTTAEIQAILDDVINKLNKTDTTLMLSKYLRKSNATIANIIKLQDSLSAKYTKTQSDTRFNLKVNVADTSGMLTRYQRKALNTISSVINLSDTLSARYTKTQANNRYDLKVNIADTSDMLYKYILKSEVTPGDPGLPDPSKVSVSDTASMLNNYLRKDLNTITSVVSLNDSLLARYTKLQANSRFNLKLGLADTATMLSKYLVKGNNTIPTVKYLQDSLGGRYTKPQADVRYNLKVNTADTATMLTKYLRKSETASITSKLSISDTATMLSKYLVKGNARITSITGLTDSLTNKYTKAKANQNVNDSLNDLRINADLLIDIGFIHADTLDLLLTHNQFATLNGSGGSGGGSATSSLYFRVGTTSGAPIAGDSVIQNVTGLAAKHIEVYRGTTSANMSLMPRNVTGVGVGSAPYTYHYVPATGKITVRPQFATNDRFEVWASDSTTWTDLAFSGTGGNNILDANLLAFWKFDETSGTRMDATPTNADLTPFGSLSYSGTSKFGNSVSASGDKRSGMSVTGLGIAPTGNEYTIAFWIYLDSLPSVLPVVGTAHDYYVFYGNNTGTNDLTCYIPTAGSTPNRIRFKYYDNGVLMDFAHPTTLEARTWYCVAAVVRSMDNSFILLQKMGDASPTAGYDNADMATGLDAPNSSFTIMNASSTSTVGVDGYLDIMGVWDRAWNTVDFAEFFKAGAGHNYPF